MVRLTFPMLASLTLATRSAAAFVPTVSPPVFHYRHFSTSTSDDEPFATPDEIQNLLQNERTVILDVRRAEEILESGYLQTSQNAWVTIPCTPTDASLLKMTASNLLKDKTAPILVHCALGKRAAKAKQVLEELGYENVVNAGGFSALESFVEKKE